MDDHWIYPPASENDPVERLRALQQSQTDLWATLRNEDDPEARMALLSQFSENRAAIEQLTEELSIDPAQLPPTPPAYRVELVEDSEPVAADDVGIDEAPQATQEQDPFLSYDDHVMPSRIDDDTIDDPLGLSSAWEQPDDTLDPAPIHPQSGADFGRYPAPVDRGPGAEPGRDLAPIDPRSGAELGGRFEPPAGDPYGEADTAFGSGASFPPMAEASAPTGHRRPISPRATGELSRAPRSEQVTIQESSRRTYAVLGGLVAVLAISWLVLSGGSDDEPGSDGESALAADGGEVAPAGPTADAQLDEIVAVLRGLGLDGVGVERRGEVIHLIGTVPTVGEREAAIGAVQAVSDGTPVDAAELLAQGPAEAVAAPTDPTGRAAALQTEINRVVASTPIIFDVGQTELSELHIRILNTVAGAMLAHPDIPVTIVGFTDDTGSDESNRQISLDRANSVRNYLISQGVPEAGLTLDARGEDTSSGSQALANLERRVEFEVAATEAAPVAPAAPLRVAIVAPSAQNDLAFTQSMVDAVNAIATQRGNVEVAVTDSTFVPEEAATAIRDYAAQDFDLIVAHGSQFGGPLLEIAQEFPDVAFAWGTASDTFGLSNVYAYDAASEQGGFVMGAMASLLSSTGVIGVVGPIEVGDAERYVNGFRTGAVSEQPGANVLVTYTGSFSDLTLAAETARAHVGAGADVMTGSAQMVVGAVSVATENGGLWFGTQANQASLAPSLVVASQVYHWEVILAQIVADIDSGAIGGQTYTAALSNGGLVIEFNPDYPLPDAVRQRADQIVAAIVDGSIVVPTS